MPGPYLELEEKLRPLADPLPPPQPGDWLAEHDEPGQTFAEYLDARPVRKSDKLHTIYLCLVGDFTEAQRRILDLTRDCLATFFGCPVKVKREVALASIPARARRTHPSCTAHSTSEALTSMPSTAIPRCSASCTRLSGA